MIKKYGIRIEIGDVVDVIYAGESIRCMINCIANGGIIQLITSNRTFFWEFEYKLQKISDTESMLWKLENL